MRYARLTFLLLVFAAADICPADPVRELKLYDLEQKTEKTLTQEMPVLLRHDVVLIGELHTFGTHHDAQLEIIQALHEFGAELAIGLEMFRDDSQNVLDDWINGDISEEEFKQAFADNWNMPWALYRKTFNYAADQRIPMIGLNISGDITARVSRFGFKALSPEQRRRLPDITCDVEPDYMEFIRRAYTAREHWHLNFKGFCEAQLLWDTVMAIHALDYLQTHPGSIVVILAGTGHVWKKAVPRQIGKRSDRPYVVIMPEIPGIIDPAHVGTDECDYIILDQEPDHRN